MRPNIIDSKILYLNESHEIDTNLFKERFKIINENNFDNVDYALNFYDFSLIIIDITDDLSHEKVINFLNSNVNLDLPVMFICKNFDIPFLNNVKTTLYNDFIVCPYDDNELFYRCNKLVNEFKSHKTSANTKNLESMKDLLSNISHHWRQPLNVISIAAHNIKQINSELNDEDTEKFLSYIISCCMNLSTTIDVFKNIYVAKEISEVYLKEEIQNAIIKHDKKLNANNVKLIVKNSINDKLKINIAQNELSFVIANLLENSIDSYKDIESDIEKTIKLNVFIKDDELNINVEDYGIGITEESMKNIFNAYFTTKDGDKREGLGLFISHVIVNSKLKGEISCTKIDDMTQFEIKIPLKNLTK